MSTEENPTFYRARQITANPELNHLQTGQWKPSQGANPTQTGIRIEAPRDRHLIISAEAFPGPNPPRQAESGRGVTPSDRADVPADARRTIRSCGTRESPPPTPPRARIKKEKENSRRNSGGAKWRARSAGAASSSTEERFTLVHHRQRLSSAAMAMATVERSLGSRAAGRARPGAETAERSARSLCVAWRGGSRAALGVCRSVGSRSNPTQAEVVPLRREKLACRVHCAHARLPMHI